MNTFEYKAKDQNGKICRGKIECSGEKEFYKLLQERGLFCMEVYQRQERAKKQVRRVKWKPKETAMFCREFSVMLTAGMNMLTALQLLYDRAAKVHQKNSYMQMMEGIEKGDTLYDAMRKQKNVFPKVLLSMVLAGESSGTMDDVMGKMADYYDKEADLQAKLINAMIYPMILITITAGVVLVLFTFVLPQFFSLFKGKEVPAITTFFMNISLFLTSYWYLLLLAILVIVVIIKMMLRNEQFRARMDEWVLKIPIMGGLMEKLLVARFANVMNILYSSGITIVQSISISVETVSNRYLAAKLNTVNELIEKGVSLSEAMQREKLFDSLTWSMIQIGEESGSLEMMFLKLSEYYTRESETATQKMMSLMEPLVLVFIAIVIATVIASILLPIYNMYQLR